jgi:hypothetical protein
MNTYINYPDALRHIIDLSDTVSLAQLEFLTVQQTVAEDANLDHRIRFVTIACHLNEFLYTHHPVINGVPWTATWLFHIGKGYVKCFPYALFYWTLRLFTMIGNQCHLDLLQKTQVTALSVPIAQLNLLLGRIASVMGIRNYCLRQCAGRLPYIAEDLAVEMLEMKQAFLTFDYLFGWLSAAKLYYTYGHVPGSKTEDIIKKAFEYARSCSERLDKEADLPIQFKHIALDCKRIQYLALGHLFYRGGDSDTAASMWKLAHQLGAVLATDQEECIRDVEGDQPEWVALTEVAIQQLSPFQLPLMPSFCSKGFDPLSKEPCRFRLITK